MEFEKAIAAHAQKFHTGDRKWRVIEIQSAPEARLFFVKDLSIIFLTLIYTKGDHANPAGTFTIWK